MKNKPNRILIIDALNMYYRAYIVDPSLSTNGDPIGGVKGFLKILQKLIRETSPEQIIIAWDGVGGSRKRKAVNKNYKEGRKPLRLNRDIKSLTENEELQNKIWQQSRLIEYLNQTPVIQYMFPETEADDVIAFLIKTTRLNGKQKVIVSSDKDFFQLCNSETVIYRPVQKEVMNAGRIVEKYGIHPVNFALARAIVGDKSDNLAGVPSVGLSTVAKRLSFLQEEEFYTISDVVQYCKDVEKPLKAHVNISKNSEIIAENYKLMQLYSPMLSVQTKKQINNTLDNFVHEFNKTEVHKMMIKDGFGSYDWTELFLKFRKLVIDNK